MLSILVYPSLDMLRDIGVILSIQQQLSARPT